VDIPGRLLLSPSRQAAKPPSRQAAKAIDGTDDATILKKL